MNHDNNYTIRECYCNTTSYYFTLVGDYQISNKTILDSLSTSFYEFERFHEYNHPKYN